MTVGSKLVTHTNGLPTGVSPAPPARVFRELVNGRFAPLVRATLPRPPLIVALPLSGIRSWPVGAGAGYHPDCCRTQR
jgi:hypothetical protein